MDYSLYFEKVPEGKEPNEFQYNDCKGTMGSWLGCMLFFDWWKDENGKIIDQSDYKAEFINEFLNYHFSKYKGNPEQFFLCLKDLIISTNNKGHPIPGTLSYAIPGIASHYSRLDKLYSPVIEKWIEKMENMPHHKWEEKPKIEYKSLRRVYSFILAEAYHNGHSEIKNMGKIPFKDYVSKLFKDAKKANEIYQTVRSTYKTESNFLNFFENMRIDHSKDHAYAMKIYKNYFPESLKIKSK